MKIKRMELENFKTFKGTCVFDFDYGFIGVTGPNGSGKSNFSDAIEFLLGPKSARRLRIQRLSELAYNGGKKGRPATECKVSIVFDNMDRTMPVPEDEVRITRKIKITNRKEDKYISNYYVNGKPMKQSDVHLLLKSARIFPDGYNIIQQGDIMNFIKISKIDRRKLIDEVSGVSEYDNHIKKAREQQKIVEENTNIIKARMEELDNQLSHLKGERDLALKYIDLMHQRDITRWKLLNRQKKNLLKQKEELLASIERTKEEMKKARASIEEMNSKKDALEYRKKQLEAEISRIGGEKAEELNSQMKALRQGLVEAKAHIEGTQNKLEDAGHVIEMRTREIKKAEKEINDIMKELNPISELLKDKMERRDQVQKRLKTLRNEASKGSENIRGFQQAIDKLTVEIADIDDKIINKRGEVKGVESELQVKKTELESHNNKLNNYKTEESDARWRLKETKNIRKELDRKIQEIQDRFMELHRRERSLEGALDDITSEMNELNRKYATLKAKKEVNENYDSHTRAVNGILEARNRGIIKGIIGTASELMEVNEDLQTAISVVGGSRLKAILVENEDVAAEAIRYLKTNKLGRATFLPLTKMLPGRPRGKALMAVRDKDALGFALDLIKYDERYKNAFWYIFGDTVVVRDMTVAKKLMGGVRLVTLDGSLVEASGAMTGGNLSKRQKIVFGKDSASELNRIGKQLTELRNEQEELSSQLVSVRQEKRATEEELRKLKDETGAAQYTQLEKMLEDARAAIKDEKAKIATINEQITGLNNDITRLNNDLSSLSKLKKEKLEEISTLKEKIRAALPANLEKETEELNEALEALNSDITALSEKANALKSKIDTARTISDEYKAEVIEKKDRINKLQKDLEIFKKEEAEYARRIRDIEEKLEKLDSRISGLKEERDKVERDIGNLENRIEKMQVLLSDNNDRLFRLKGDVNRIDDDISRAINSINEITPKIDKLIEPESREKMLSTLMSEVTLQEKLSEIEHNIDQLGPVNQLAIETYDELSTRKANMKDELSNLEEEKKRWIQMEKDTRKQKKEIFLYVFNQINENLKRIYHKLSNGGEATLELENEEDPFDGGMEIRVQPLGKKMTRLDSLSGGEKGVVTMALMFAIQEYEPSPFYLLDEVDQNLDAINAEIIGRMIKQNSQTAQFIVISLHRVTLKDADIIYGVTGGKNAISEVYAISNLQIGDEGHINIRANKVGGVTHE